MRAIEEHNFIKYLRKKDERALDYVIDVYSGLIRSIVRKHLGNIGQFEEECINDVLLAIWNGIDCFDEQENNFKNWVAAISKYKSIDYKRKYIKLLQEVEIEKADRVHTLSAEEKLLQSEINEELESMLSSLLMLERDLLKAYYLQDEPIHELADKMGIKTSAIYNKLSRSRKKLRNVFRSYKEGGIRE